MFVGKMVCSQSRKGVYLFYILAVLVGIFSGITDLPVLHGFAEIIANIFIRIFKFISLPLISLSLIVSLARCTPEQGMGKMWKLTIYYTIATTLLAACVALVLYKVISPANMTLQSDISNVPVDIYNAGYLKYIVNLVPQNFLAPFLEGQIIGIFLICGSIAIAIHFIPDTKTKSTVIALFEGMYSVFSTITSWLMKIIPLALGCFITITILQFKKGLELMGLGEYLAIILLANLVQGAVVLPIFLYFNGLNPLRVFKGMIPALVVAFFSKSSTGTLPVTMKFAEKNLHISPQISRSILPFCTSVNMNGCAAFIFTTVIYVMQNHGADITLATMFLWVFIACFAAIGNAGVPMGCFFLSASLLTNIGIPINLMSIILPLYSFVDMFETSLNVWSDSCVTAMVDKKYSPSLEEVPENS
ncbi:dicarboxylate/amino acid:cation symporter [Candidatus Liberibacter sp.]|uniref:dicarboxylate/amino acid:cation symporter n=1 Tax=Candidatus Liberibacter sp. TaxID=34022 RepID=UPI0015F41E4C|nr:dicarboxylate/amino acid:cation symporter [Candidatus Liberibacter sp.]MBA5723856.1 dicarboxylate/amino acid:cation symporter [Candidatus Liberibacter sp.]